MVNDRFEEIKANFYSGWTHNMHRLRDIGWLIGEIERLRSERAQLIADAATAVEEMRSHDERGM
jgi:hypothetical protein